ncbi:MAG TPA: PEP-CTERM sorting domain-containing protein [Tepidisphaeraceae bacterium]|nr:PEP-CTERM sorting domain-containing protein [Tepidisphaeraceae bacterium]
MIGSTLLASQSFAAITDVPDSNHNNVIDLADLIATGSTGFDISDKHFSNFSYTPSGATAPAASSIVVSDVSTPAGVAISYNFNWSTLNGISMDSRIDYRVDVTDPDPATMIDAVDLAFDGSASNAAVADVSETVNDTSGNFLTQLAVFTDPDGAGPLQGVSSVTSPLLPPQRGILVDKDIQLFSAPTTSNINNMASINFVENSYHQTPEPACLAMLGLVGSICAMRRRRI